jgi:hypothetical protein
VQLGDAASTLYGSLGDCYVRDFIERIGTGNDGIVNVMARTIAGCADIFGVRGPSKTVQLIDHQTIENSEFCDFARNLRTPGTDPVDPIWTGLLISRKEFDRASIAVLNARHSSSLQIR